MKIATLLTLLLCPLFALSACKDDKGAGSSAAEPKTVTGKYEKAKVMTAETQLKNLHFNGYAMWAVNNSDAQCPATLAEVAALVGKETRDPWGQELIMVCGDDAPPEAKDRFGVISKGADGKRGTDDDIRSWTLEP